MAKRTERGKAVGASFDDQSIAHVEGNDWRGLIELYAKHGGPESERPEFWDELINHLSLMVKNVDDAQDKSKLLTATGEILNDRLNAPVKAVKRYQMAFTTWPLNFHALSLARGIYREKGKHALVIKLYEHELKVVGTGKRQASILTKIGRYLLETGGDEKAAESRLALALTVDPNNDEARRLLDKLTGEVEEEPEAKEEESVSEEAVEEQEAVSEPEEELEEEPDSEEEPEEEEPEEDKAVSEPEEELEEEPDSEEPADESESAEDDSAEPETPDVAVHLAKASSHKKAGRFDQATQRYRDALEIDEKNLAALNGLVHCLREGDDNEKELASTLERLSKVVAGKDARRRVLRELAVLYSDPLNDPKSAVDAFERQLEHNPSDPEALSYVFNHHSENDNWEQLTTILEAAVATRRRVELDFNPQLELAEILWVKLGELDRAESHFKRLKLLNPKNPRVLSFYADYYRRRDEFNRLRSILETLRTVDEDPEARLEYALEIAELAEHRLNQPDLAIRVWESIVQGHPDRTEPAEALRRLYATTQKHNALLEFLKGQVDKLDEEQLSEKVELLFEMADVYREHLNLEGMEANTLASILEIDPTNQRAADTLVARFEESGRWSDLVETLRKGADLEESPHKEAALRTRMADILRYRLKNVGNAIVELKRVLELQPDNADALAELAEIFGKRGEQRELLRILEKQADLTDGEQRLAKLHDMARIAREDLSDESETKRITQLLLTETDGNDDVALEFQEEIHRSHQDWAGVVRILGMRRPLCETPDDEISVLIGMSDLYADELDDVEKAFECLNQALEIDSEHSLATRRIVDLFIASEQWDGLVDHFSARGEWSRCCDILMGEAERVEEEDAKVALLQRVSRIAEDELHDPEQVIKALGRILALRPTAEVAEQLVPYYEGAAEHDKLVEVLAILADSQEGSAALQAVRRIAEIYERDLEEPDGAVHWAGRAVELDPDNRSTREAFERLARQVDRLDELVFQLQDLAEEQSGDTRLALLWQAARICSEELSDRHGDMAIDLFTAIVQEDPNDRRAITKLEELQTEAGNYSDLLATLRKRLELVADDQGKAELNLRIAQIQHEQLKDTQAAVRTYRVILKLDPANDRALEQLKRAYAEESEWDNVAEVAQLQLEAAPEQRQIVLFELAQVCQHKTNDLRKAIEAYAQLIREFPDSTLAERAVGSLTSIEDDDFQTEIAETLEPVYRADENWDALTQALELLVESDSDGSEKQVERLWDLADVYEKHLSQLAKAYVSAQKAIKAGVVDEKNWDELERLADANQEWDPTADLYRAAIEKQPDDLTLVVRLARLCQDKLRNVDEAISVWEQVQEANPTDKEAIGALERLYPAAEKVDELVGLLAARADAETKKAKRKALLFRITDVLHEAGRPLDAVPYYEQVLELDEKDRRAFDALRTLLDASTNWTRLIEVLIARLEVAPKRDRAELRMQLGGLYDRELDNQNDAFDVFRDILVENPKHKEATLELEQLARHIINRDEHTELRAEIYQTLQGIYEANDAWEDLIRMKKIQLSDPGQTDEQGFTYRLVAEILRDRLGRKEEALENLSAAFRIDFEDSQLLSDVEQLAIELKAWESLVMLFEMAVETIEDDYLRVEYNRRLAQLYEEHTDDSDGAIACYEQVLSTEPDDKKVLEALERLHLQANNMDDLVDIRKRKVNLTSGQERLELLRQIADDVHNVLRNEPEAIDAYRNVLLEKPGDTEALDSLEDLLLATGQWEDLLDILREKLDLAEDAEDRTDILQQMASVAEDRLEDWDTAIEAYCSVLDVDAQNGVALAALERIYEQTKNWSELAGILQRQMELYSEPEHRGASALRLGKVLESKLGERGQALSVYRDVLKSEAVVDRVVEAVEAALTDDEYASTAADILLPHYEGREDWEDVVRLLQRRVETTSADNTKLELLDRMREVLDERLGDKKRALQAACRSYTLAPNSMHREVAEQLADVSSNYVTLAEAYEGVLESDGAGEEALTVSLRLAEIFEDLLEDTERAESEYRRALGLAPDCEEALEALETLYEGQNRVDDLLSILECRVELAQSSGDVENALEFLHRIASIHDDVAGDVESAISAWERALESSETDVAAYASLNRLYRNERKWDDLVELLERQIGATTDQTQIVDLKLEVGQVYYRELSAYGRALDSFSEVLALSAEHAEAISRLQEFIDAPRTLDSEFIVRAAEVLEPEYRKSENWSRLTQMLEVRARQAEPESAADFLIEAANLHETRLDGIPTAFERLMHVFELTPDRQSVWEDLERLAGQVNGWKPLTAAMEKEFSDRTKISEDSLLPLAARLGVLLDEYIGDLDRSRRVLEFVVEAEPDHRQAQESLERVYSGLQAWDDLVDLYRRRADFSEDASERLTTLLKVSRLQEEILSDRDAAIETYRQVLDLDPTNTEAFRALERLFEYGEQFESLVELLDRRASVIDDDEERAELYYQLGQTLQTDLDSAEQAVPMFRQVLELVVGHESAIHTLDVLLTQLREQNEQESLRLQIASILEGALDAERDWSKLVELCDAQLEVVDDSEDRQRVLRRAAELAEKHGKNSEKALVYRAQAFREDPLTPENATHLERLAEECRAYQLLADTLVAGLPIIEDEDETRAVQLMLRTSDLFETQLQDRLSAARLLEEARELDAYNEQALSRLERLYRHSSQYAELVEVLSSMAEATTEFIDQKEILYRIAEIQEQHLDDPVSAAAAFKEILQLDPEDIVALESLERLLRQSSDFRGLAATITHKIDVVEDKAERRKLQLELAEVYDRSLSDLDSAVNIYRNLIANDPNDMEPILALDRLFGEHKQWADLLDIIELRRGLAKDPAEVEAHDLRSARLMAEHLGAIPRAIEMYRRILKNSPENEQAGAALESLLDSEHKASVISVLEPIYRERNDWERVIGLLNHKLEDEDDTSRQYVTLRQIGKIWEEKLANPKAAFDTFARALAEQADEPEALGEMARLADEENLWKEFAEILDQVTEFASTEDTRRLLQLNAAETYAEKLDDPTTAVSRYQTVLSSHPLDRQALKALDQLYFKERDWEALADILEREIQIAPQDEAALELRFRLAYILEVVFMEVERSIDLYEEILATKSDHDKAIESLQRLAKTPEWGSRVTGALAGLFRRSGSFTKLVQVYETALEVEEAPTRRAELYKQRGDVFLEDLDDLNAAFAEYSQSVREVPDDDKLLEKLELLASELKNWPELIALFDEIRDSIREDKLRLDTTKKLARWYEEKLRQPDRAEGLYWGVLETDPTDRDTISALEKLYRGKRDYSALIEVLLRRVEAETDSATKKDCLDEIVRLAEGEVGDLAAAARAQSVLLELEPANLDRAKELVRLYRELRMPENLVDALVRLAEVEKDTTSRTELLLEAGQIALEQLGENDRAIKALAAAFELEPHRDDLVATLEGLYGCEKDYESLRRLCERRIEVLDGPEKHEVIHRLAVLLNDHLDDSERAIDLLLKLRDSVPDYQTGLAALATILHEKKQWQELGKTWLAQLSLLEESEGQRGEAVQLAIKLAELQNETLSQVDSAIVTYRRAFQLDDTNKQVVSRLRELLISQDLWEEALKVITHEIELKPEPDLTCGLLFQQGCLLEKTGAQPNLVIKAWEAALELEPKRIDIAEALVEQYRSEKRWRDVFSTLLSIAQDVDDPRRARTLAADLVAIARDKLSDEEDLATALELAHRITPDDVSVTQELAQAYMDCNDFDKAAPLIDEVVAQRGDSGHKRDRAGLLHLKGRVAQGMGRAEEAEKAFEKAYETDATFLPNLMSLAMLRFAQADLDNALKLFQTMLLHQMSLKSDRERVDIFYHMGLIMRAKGDKRRARDMFMRALSVDRGHDPSQTQLKELESLL